MAEANKTKPYEPSHRIGLTALRNRPIASKIAAWLTLDDLIEHCQSRLVGGTTTPQTVKQDVSWISGVLTRAGLSTEVIRRARPILNAQGLIGNSKKRFRRPTPDEIARVMDFYRSQWHHPRTVNPMTILVEFALASGRTVSQITKLKWADLDEKTRTCVAKGERFRLLGKAWDIVVAQPRTDDAHIFPYKSTSISASFAKLKDLKACTFQDLRLEATCRMLESGYSIDEVSDATGQKNLQYISQVKRLLIDQSRAAAMP